VIGNVGKDSELRIEIRFSTKEPNGLLLWQGRTEKKQNWISVGSKNNNNNKQQSTTTFTDVMDMI
jgi:hypothetical protein